MKYIVVQGENKCSAAYEYKYEAGSFGQADAESECKECIADKEMKCGFDGAAARSSVYEVESVKYFEEQGECIRKTADDY